MYTQDFTSLLVDTTGGGGGGTITMDHAAPMDPSILTPPTPILPSGPSYPAPGNAVTQPPPTVDTVPNQVTLTATGPLTGATNEPSPAPPPVTAASFPWAWVLAAVGGAYLLSEGTTRRAGAVGKKKGGMLVPVVVVGGIAAWYLLGKKQTTPVVLPPPVYGSPGGPSGGGGAAPIVTSNDPDVQLLQSQYAGQQKQLTVISNADPVTIANWARIVRIWQLGVNPYNYDLNGTLTTDYNGSVGKWWENFSAAQGF